MESIKKPVFFWDSIPTVAELAQAKFQTIIEP